MGFGLDARLPASSVRRPGGWAAGRLGVDHLASLGRPQRTASALPHDKSLPCLVALSTCSHECRFSGFFLTAS